MNAATLFSKILGVFRIRPTVGGFEISDTAFRFAYRDGDAWRVTSLRLPPGLIVKGDVKDYPRFVEALTAFRSRVVPLVGSRRTVTVILSLSSVNIYTQIFTLPAIEGENLEKAIQLNVQMASSAEPSEKYSGWQLMGEDPDSVRLEVLSAFIDRSVVDGVTRALREAGFLVAAVESRALSLTRLLREAGDGYDRQKPTIVMSIDSSGLEFLVVRRGHLYFQYFHAWEDVQGEERAVTSQMFEAVIVRNFHQVLNFYGSHWQEPLTEVFVSASAMADEVIRILGENFSLNVHPLVLTGNNTLDPEWFVAMGTALRGLTPRRADRDLSLLGVSAQDEFRREQVLNFAHFWRILVPVPLVLLVGVFLVTNRFLVRTRESLDVQSQLSVQGEQAKQIDALKAQALEFNRTVDLASSALRASIPHTPLLEKVRTLLMLHGIALTHFSFQTRDAPLTLSGVAASGDEILKFKQALDNDLEVRSINLNFSDIVPTDQGFSFSVTFFANASSTP